MEVISINFVLFQEVELDSFGGMTVTRIEFLRNVLKDALLKILELSPFDKPFLIVGRALKLAGAALDESDCCDTESSKQSSRSKTDRIYTHIEAIHQDDNTSELVNTNLSLCTNTLEKSTLMY